MTKLRVYIVTEVTDKSGWGHINRCLSIYQAFMKVGIAPFFIINGGSIVSGILQEVQHLLINWTVDQKRFLEYIRNTDVVIVDSYLADLPIYESISEIVLHPIFLDDTIRLNYPAGTILNGTIFAEQMNYTFKKNRSFLLGSQYALLREDFWSITKREINYEISNILITFGGSDIRNLTRTVLEAVCHFYPDTKKHVVIGESKSNVDFIEKYKSDKILIYKSISASDMKALMLACDLAISASGQTINELARCGTPTVAVKVIENQSDILRGWVKAGFLLDFIDYLDYSDSALLMQINNLMSYQVRTKIAEIGQKNVDGKGPKRIVSFVLEKFIQLERADNIDLIPLFKLANDPYVRSNSFTNKEITLEEHKSWFQNLLADASRLLLVAKIDNRLLGQVRFDRKDSEIVTSISVSSEFRGFGLGEILLRISLDKLHQEWPDAKSILAFIKNDNMASRFIFEKVGYSLIEERDDVLKYTFDYV